MPRYFFDLEDHHKETDDVGEELAGPTEARIQAILFLGGILRDDPDIIWDGRPFTIRVKDADGAPVLAVQVRAMDGDAS